VNMGPLLTEERRHVVVVTVCNYTDHPADRQAVCVRDNCKITQLKSCTCTAFDENMSPDYVTIFALAAVLYSTSRYVMPPLH